MTILSLHTLSNYDTGHLVKCAISSHHLVKRSSPSLIAMPHLTAGSRRSPLASTILRDGIFDAATSSWIISTNRILNATVPFVPIPPHLALSKVMQRNKGRSFYKIQREFPESRKRYWGQPFWARGCFSTTSGNVTDDIIRQYLELQSKPSLTSGIR